MSHRSRTLRVSSLARVEGEGALDVTVDSGVVADVRLNIYEPPRFFEAFLRGRHASEAPDITARICGICPVAYQTSAWQAIESIGSQQVGPEISALRRLLYCGEWVSSHALHIYLLHAPDFLGYPDAVAMAVEHREVVERGLRLKRAGNAILDAVGGRAIHPVNTRVGGFYRAPAPGELATLAERLRAALDDALATVAWVATFHFPDLTIEHDLLALSVPGQYAIEVGTPTVSTGLVFPASDYSEHVVERQVPHSTALHAVLDGRRYLTGPLARYTLNANKLSPLAREVTTAAGLGWSCRNPFRSIIVRAVEVVYALEEALRIIEHYRPPDPPAAAIVVSAGTGHGVSEAPRGLLYHRYDIGDDGLIRSATIVPPTSQNQDAIEDDLRTVLDANLELDDAALTGLCEQTIRNYDPCISCSAHFLDLRLTRR